MNAKKWIVVILPVAGALSLAALYIWHSKSIEGGSADSELPSVEPDLSVYEQKENQNQPTLHLNISTVDNLTHLESPTLDQVRQEAAENPHSPPISIIGFSAMLGPKMETALESEAAAIELFKELEIC